LPWAEAKVERRDGVSGAEQTTEPIGGRADQQQRNGDADDAVDEIAHRQAPGLGCHGAGLEQRVDGGAKIGAEDGDERNV
jgi:hypothetical protein